MRKTEVLAMLVNQLGGVSEVVLCWMYRRSLCRRNGASKVAP